MKTGAVAPPAIGGGAAATCHPRSRSVTYLLSLAPDIEEPPTHRKRHRQRRWSPAFLPLPPPSLSTTPRRLPPPSRRSQLERERETKKPPVLGEASLRSLSSDITRTSPPEGERGAHIPGPLEPAAYIPFALLKNGLNRQAEGEAGHVTARGATWRPADRGEDVASRRSARQLSTREGTPAAGNH